MDIDRYIATHTPAWQRLGELSKGGRKRAETLSGAEITELVRLYQQTSTHLSYAQTFYQDQTLVGHLTTVVNQSRAMIYSTKPRGWSALREFLAISLPLALVQARRYIVVSAALLLVPALVAGMWIATSSQAADVAIPEAAREAYLNHDFEAYYESERASQFATQVYTNNVVVAVTAFAGGMLLGIPTVQSLITNGVNIGFAAGIFTHYGQTAKFWGLITPHGLLELTSVILAGAAGLQLAWAAIDPGDRPRRDAIAAAGRSAMAIVLGVIITLAAAGLIEGFVTGQPWPTTLRVGIGVAGEAIFVLWVVAQGLRHRHRLAGTNTDRRAVRIAAHS